MTMVFEQAPGTLSVCHDTHISIRVFEQDDRWVNRPALTAAA